MRSCTNILLKKARALAKSANFEINSINDITQFLIQNRTFDSKISNILRESGYLDYWKNEITLHPYRYDKQKIEALLKNKVVTLGELISYCESTIESDKNGEFDHWFKTLEAYKYYYSQTRLATFNSLIKTYIKICDNHKKRVKVANYFLKKYQI